MICKVLEGLVREHLSEFMKTNKLLSPKQYGFIKGRSTTLQLLKVLDDWTRSLEKGKQIDTIYMDFKKAFDTVPHRRLIGKLKSYHISAELTRWIENFLEEREQHVGINGKVSRWHKIMSGIPQGSVLGPFLFVLYINDLPDTLESTPYMYADDTKIYRNIEGRHDIATLQTDLNKLQHWSDKWLLRFHPDKCKQLTIGRQHFDTEYHLYTDEGNQRKQAILEKCAQEKYIGVVMDNDLSFEQHMSDKIKKANSIMGVIRRTFNNLNNTIFIMLYKGLVRPHLEYASSVWAPHKAKNIIALEKVQ